MIGVKNLCLVEAEKTKFNNPISSVWWPKWPEAIMLPTLEILRAHFLPEISQFRWNCDLDK